MLEGGDQAVLVWVRVRVTVKVRVRVRDRVRDRVEGGQAVLVEGEQLHGRLAVDLELHARSEAARACVDLVRARV